MRVRTPAWGALVVCLLTFALADAAQAATIAVPAGGDLQAAINAALPGDVITLPPGATFVGNFTLPDKGNSTLFITIRSAASDSSLPPDGVRMTPEYAALLPKIQSATSVSALRTRAGAHHWKLMFLEFRANLAGYGDIVALGAGDSTQTQLSQVPYEIVVDRVYVHGDPVMGQKRGISLNSRDTQILNSYISDIKAVGQDSQALGGFNGPGNYLIENNYLEAAAENFLLGGADPPIPNLVTTNVTFRRNHLRKPLEWRDPIIATPADIRATAAVGAGALGAGTYAYKVVARMPAGQTTKANSPASAEVTASIPAGTVGGVTITWTAVAGATEYYVYGRTTGATNKYWKTTTPYFTDTGAAGTAGSPTSSSKWTVKNLFELKNAQDVLVEGNVFENNWVADQPGYAIVFTPRNQSGSAPWSVVQRVMFRTNLIRHVAGGFNILGTDNINPSQLTNNIIIRDNVCDDLGTAWGSGAKTIQIGDGSDAITFDHNTIDSNNSAVVAVYGGSGSSPTPITRFTYTNNVSEHRTYGIWGAGLSTGMATINAYLPGSTIQRNVLAGGSASKYPADNFFPTVAAWTAGFVDFAGGDYHLLSSNAYAAAASDGGPLGANIDAVASQAVNALSGDNRLAPGISHVQILTSSLPNGMLNQSYAQGVACAGGSAPCAWQLSNAALPAGLSFDAAAGVVLGTPSAVQTGTVTVTAYDPTSPSNSSSATLTVTVDAPPFTIAVPAAPQGTVGLPYELRPAVSGAIGAVTWSLAAGSLPAGLTLDPWSGAIAGTPSSWGTATALLQAQDSWGPGRVDAAAVTITAAPAPLTIASALPPATYQQFYQSLLNASGGTGATQWAIVGGALPPGVMADANGAISGTPSGIGTYQVTVRATDVNWPSNEASAALALVVNPPPFSIALAAAPLGQVGAAYSVAGSATGNVGAVSWSLASGSLPPGVVLDAATGTIAGVPTVPGSFAALVQGRDTWNSSRVATAAIGITVAPVNISVSTTALPGGTVRAWYQSALVASGGSGSTLWSVAAGALPPGLVLNSDGLITGTPTALGSFTFTARATDAAWPTNTATRPLTIAIASRDIVLYAADASAIHGAWTPVVDATAAGGQRLANPDAGAAKITTPAASPASYFELTFQAEAGVPYHLWIRGKAEKNFWGNDSIYVQFSGSVAPNGTAVSRIGTTTAQTLSIENGINAGLSGWGWNDDAYEGLAAPIYFATTGPQTVRVQVREDGISIDQLVLSADAYAAAAPGAAKNDTTILQK